MLFEKLCKTARFFCF